MKSEFWDLSIHDRVEVNERHGWETYSVIETIIDPKGKRVRIARGIKHPCWIDEDQWNRYGFRLAHKGMGNNPCAEIPLQDLEWSPLTIETLSGANLDKFAADYFGLARAPGYPDANFKQDLLAAMRSRDFGSIRPAGVPLKPACTHEWICDYQSMFHPSQDKYSCKHCKIKKEEV